MKFLRHIICTCALLLLFACGSVKPFTQMYDTQMMNDYDGIYTCWQLDSICEADTLDRDLDSWLYIPLRDKETGENVSQYVYIKALGENEVIYRLQQVDSCLYKITKRVTR